MSPTLSFLDDFTPPSDRTMCHCVVIINPKVGKGRGSYICTEDWLHFPWAIFIVTFLFYKNIGFIFLLVAPPKTRRKLMKMYLLLAIFMHLEELWNFSGNEKNLLFNSKSQHFKGDYDLWEYLTQRFLFKVEKGEAEYFYVTHWVTVTESALTWERRLSPAWVGLCSPHCRRFSTTSVFARTWNGLNGIVTGSMHRASCTRRCSECLTCAN